jgi:hypothetical protein
MLKCGVEAVKFEQNVLEFHGIDFMAPVGRRGREPDTGTNGTGPGSHGGSTGSTGVKGREGGGRACKTQAVFFAFSMAKIVTSVRNMSSDGIDIRTGHIVACFEKGTGEKMTSFLGTLAEWC